MYERANRGQTQPAADNRGWQITFRANTQDVIHFVAPGVGKLAKIENQSGWTPDP